jgi:hypothetical protein
VAGRRLSTARGKQDAVPVVIGIRVSRTIVFLLLLLLLFLHAVDIVKVTFFRSHGTHAAQDVARRRD